jgi:metal-responsive CopG/Arc/MetJ family transcriptional regulator
MAKVMVSLPDELLHRIDAEARRRATTRSGFLQEAAARALDRSEPEAMGRAIDRTRELVAKAQLQGDSAALVREERGRREERDRARGSA